MSKHTPGPWYWYERADGEVYLATPDKGHLVVMDFVRKGMQKGQPRFAHWKGDERENMGGIMVPADKMNVAKHPDAKLMSAAPDLLAAVRLLLAVFAPIYSPIEATDAFSSAVINARAAIAKALGAQS